MVENGSLCFREAAHFKKNQTNWFCPNGSSKTVENEFQIHLLPPTVAAELPVTLAPFQLEPKFTA